MAGDEVKSGSRRMKVPGGKRRGRTSGHGRERIDKNVASSSVKAETPQDLQELRNARLKYLAKTPEERVKDAKMAQTQTREKITRGSTIVASGSARPRPALSAVSRSRMARSTTSRKKHEGRLRRSASNVSDDQYVYRKVDVEDKGKGRERDDPRDERGGAVRDDQQQSRQISSSRHHSQRRTPSRRRTEPAKRSDPVPESSSRHRPAKEKDTASRKSNTELSSTDKPPMRRREAVSATKVEAQSSKQEIEPKSPSKRTPSLISSILNPLPPVPEKRVPCLTCGSDDIRISKSAKLPCSHRMCHDCLKRIFELSVTDPAHMPPRCCTDQHIDLKHVDKLFDNKFKRTWNRKYEEYNTKNRIYCPARGCDTWIKPKYIIKDRGRKIGRCKKCGTRVCGTCSNKMHVSRDCPEDPATKAFVEVAKQQGWQKCYACSATVELKEGCNHMTCRCQAEFCMVCGAKWKSCDCPWFNYQRVDAHLGDPARQQAEMDRRRDQVRRDEELARRLQAMGLFENANPDNRGPEDFFVGNGNANRQGEPMNQNFVQEFRVLAEDINRVLGGGTPWARLTHARVQRMFDGLQPGNEQPPTR